MNLDSNHDCMAKCTMILNVIANHDYNLSVTTMLILIAMAMKTSTITIIVTNSNLVKFEF